ncbi:TetR/AcrR family transcriptional regulator [Parvibaculum sp.]|uniref:TetR/AcrR family transcriptional regulator n=1 Tax=Parvibaculum sp. TaxID=2024848 RepID=UPI00329930E8
MTKLLKSKMAPKAENTPRRAGKKERTRQEIYRSAMRLFADSDYDNVTIEDICAAAGIAKATFFLHFAGKSALITAFNEEITHSLAERLAGHTGSAEEELLLLVSVLREAWELNAPVMHKMLRDFLDQPALVSKAAAANESVLDLVTRIVARGQERGEFVTYCQPEVAAVALVAAWSAFTAWWLQNPESDTDDINRGLLDFQLNGLKKKA